MAGTVASPAAAQGGVEDGCPVVAFAQGIQVMIDAPLNVLLEEASGVGVPVAQACVNFALSDSKGFASNPYPGELAMASPSLVWDSVWNELTKATGVPKPAPAPGYPWYAASRYPGESESRVEQPGNSLSATSTETSTKARAQFGLPQDSAYAATTVTTAESVVDPGALTGIAKAESDTQPLTFNDVLELGRVRSTASAAVDAKGAVKRESSLTIGRTTVAGQVVQVTPRGVEAAGQTAPVPGSDPAEVLKAAGVQVRYLAEEKSARGVLSAGVEVVVARETSPGSGKYNRMHYTIGRAFAAADKVEAPPGGGPGDGFSGLPGGGGPVGDTAGVGDSGAPAGGAVPQAAPAPELAASPPNPRAAPAPQVAAPVAWVGRPMDMGMAGFYLVLVCSAAAMFAGMTLLRLLGVRTRWTS